MQIDPSRDSCLAKATGRAEVKERPAEYGCLPDYYPGKVSTCRALHRL